MLSLLSQTFSFFVYLKQINRCRLVFMPVFAPACLFSSRALTVMNVPHSSWMTRWVAQRTRIVAGTGVRAWEGSTPTD